MIGFPTDVFSMGVTFMCVIAGTNPFMKGTMEATKEKNMKYDMKYKRVRRLVDNDEVASVISSMTNRLPTNRCNMHDAVVSVQLVAFNTFQFE